MCIDLILDFNKRPMGHIAHLKKQLKSMNTFENSYDYIITLIDSIITLIRKGKKPTFSPF